MEYKLALEQMSRDAGAGSAISANLNAVHHRAISSLGRAAKATTSAHQVELSQSSPHTMTEGGSKFEGVAELLEDVCSQLERNQKR